VADCRNRLQESIIGRFIAALIARDEVPLYGNSKGRPTVFAIARTGPEGTIPAGKLRL
jgi:hypothetical protein